MGRGEWETGNPCVTHGENVWSIHSGLLHTSTGPAASSLHVLPRSHRSEQGAWIINHANQTKPVVKPNSVPSSSTELSSSSFTPSFRLVSVHSCEPNQQLLGCHNGCANAAFVWLRGLGTGARAVSASAPPRADDPSPSI